MAQMIDDAKLLSSVRRVLKKNVPHEDKMLLFSRLQNNRTPNVQYLLDMFINHERLLGRKKGLDAADILTTIQNFIPEQVWLIEYQAYLYSRYAYHDIASGAIQKAHDIFTQRLNWKDEDAWFRIGTILKKHRGYGFAAQCFTNAGRPEVAARMLKSQKKFQQAGWYFEQARLWKEAALAYRRDKLFDKAGDCFAEHGDMRSAVRCWKQAGTLEKHNIGRETYRNIMSKK